MEATAPDASFLDAYVPSVVDTDTNDHLDAGQNSQEWGDWHAGNASEDWANAEQEVAWSQEAAEQGYEDLAADHMEAANMYTTSGDAQADLAAQDYGAATDSFAAGGAMDSGDF